MKLNAEALDYYGLIKSHDEGLLTTSDFVHTLAEHGWLDRYVAEFIEMVKSDIPFFEASIVA